MIIQGWGNVASAAAFYLSRMGAQIVGIIDRNGGIIAPEGLASEKIEKLFIDKQNNALPGELIPFETINKTIWQTPCDIFIPGAASKIVSAEQIQQLKENGLQVISCGANVPFTDDKIFFGETARKYDREIAIIPDFVANCGMARVFAYLMTKDAELTDNAIFEDTSNIIHLFLKKLRDENSDPLNISSRSLEIALKKIFQQ